MRLIDEKFDQAVGMPTEEQKKWLQDEISKRHGCPMCEPVRLANIDCVNHFNALDSDYKSLQSKCADYEDQAVSHRNLVRQLDVIWNGVEGAATQASLCDMVAQIAKEYPKLKARCAELESARPICPDCTKKIDEAAGVDVAALNRRIAELEEMSASSIMIKVVPGEDGMGEEIYAKSVSDVERLLTRFSEKLEEQADEIWRLKQSLDVKERCLGSRSATINSQSVRIREQAAEIERLTKERDEHKVNFTELSRAFNNQEVLIEQQAEQLAALAEQNAKMREALVIGLSLAKEYSALVDGLHHEVGCITKALALPDQSANVLNRIKAAGMMEAAKICKDFTFANNAEHEIRARAAELEGK